MIARYPSLPLDLHLQSGVAQWSPSGRRLLYQRVASGFEITTPRGRTVRKIESSLWEPSWSPDGREIIAVDRDTMPRAFVRMRADGTHLRRVEIPSAEHVGWPRWSPNGRWLAYEVGTPEGPSVWRMRPGGRRARRLGRGRLPSWSPDGRRIAFTDGPDVLTMRADGSRRRRVAVAERRGTTIAGLSWSPDGRRIAFVRQRGRSDHDRSTLVTVAARGGRERRHWRTRRYVAAIDWQPRPGVTG